MPATIQVLDASGTPVTIFAPLAPGRASAANSGPSVMCNEDFAVLQAIFVSLASPGAYQGAVANSASGQVLAAAPRNVVTVQNCSQHGFVAINPGAAADLYTEGSIMIPPLGIATLRGTAAGLALFAIALNDGTGLTIGTG